MSSRNQNIRVIAFAGVLLLSLSVWAWTKTPDKSSDSERRLLAQFPPIRLDRIVSGRWSKDFEAYAADQFPMREAFRSVKAFSAYHLMRLKDNNGIFSTDGHLSKIEYPMKHPMLENAAEKFKSICEEYLREARVYFSVIPDKNCFLAEKHGYLSLNYDQLVDEIRGKTEFMQYIDLKSALSIENYYRTDAHWRQETLVPVAEILGNAMGVQHDASYRVKTLETPLRGVYSGQYALPTEPDPIRYLDSESFAACKVTNYDTGKPVKTGLYDFIRAEGADAYDFFLSGASSLIVIENPGAASDKELILFRDSFGSSLAPLLVGGYRKITLVDLRYIPSDSLDRFIRFSDQDVLFLYSTTLLNNSNILK